MLGTEQGLSSQWSEAGSVFRLFKMNSRGKSNASPKFPRKLTVQLQGQMFCFLGKRM